MGKPFKQTSNHFDSDEADRAVQFEQWYTGIAIAGLMLMLLYTLFPYDFSLIRNFSLQSILRHQNMDGLNGLKDYLELFLHLVLLGLFSFGCVGVLHKQRLNRIGTFGLVLLLCGSVGLVTELLQSILPGRHTNLLDVFSSGLGGLLGWVVFYLWRWPILKTIFVFGQKLQRCLLPRYLVLGFVGYFLFTTVAMVFLPIETDLRNWDVSYPLILGNEFTGERPWQGTIAQVQFFDRALPSNAIAQLFANDSLRSETDSLLAAYDFTQPKSPYADQAGNLPNLVWNEQPPQPFNQNGVRLDANHWLQTSTPATQLNQPMRQNHALTVNLVAQPANLTQSGPARIVSLSKSSRDRNFTIGQGGPNLVVRLRTPSTGKNGASPPLIVPQVLQDTRPIHLVVTYTNSQLQVYVNDPQTVHTFQLPHLGYKLLYYGWIFIPLGGLMGLLLALSGNTFSKRMPFFVGGVVLPPVLLEGVLTSVDQRSFAIANVAISLGMMVITVLLTWRVTSRWFHAVTH